MLDPECIKCLYNDDTGKCKIGIREEKQSALPSIIISLNGSCLAPFVSTPCRVVREMLSIAELKSGEILYDLGSGDGRIVMLAAGEYGAKAVGFELEDELIQKSIENIREQHFEDKVKVIQENLLKADLSAVDVITMYLSPNGNREAEQKLMRELKPGARIVSLEFELPGWRLDKFCKILDNGLQYKIYLYRK